MLSFRDLIGTSKRPAKQQRAAPRPRALGRLEVLESRLLLTITANIDFDTYHFPANQVARDAIKSAIDDELSHLDDTLSAIPKPAPNSGNSWKAIFDSPETGESVEMENLEIPADTIQLYIGQRPLNGLSGKFQGGFSVNGAWAPQVVGRGHAGAPETAVAPWGGGIAFDPSVDWTQTNFVKNLVQHELGHMMGFATSFFGGAVTPMEKLLDSTGKFFTGAAAEAVYGGPVPVLNDNRGAHWDPSVMSDGREAAMGTPSNGTVAGFTSLDYAALKDMGWHLKAAATPPPPTTPAGSAEDTVTFVGFEFDNETPPSDYVPRDSSVAKLGDNLYRAKIDGSNNIVIEYSTNNGTTYGHAHTVGRTAKGGSPSLAVDDGKLKIAWTANSTGNVHVADVTLDSTGTATALANVDDLDYVSNLAPALIDSLSGGLILAVVQASDGKVLVDYKGPAKPLWLNVGFETGVTSTTSPVLTRNFGLWLHYTAGGEHDKQVILLLQTHQGLHTFPFTNGQLTLDGDQKGLGFNDDFTIDKTDAGGVMVTINGESSEYAPGEVTSIVVNTGFGTNAVHILAAFSGLPVTINGAGNDKLDFGPGLAAPTFTQDPNGLLGFGTIGVGGMTITEKSLESVSGVAPDMTGVQVTSSSIDENGVATITGTFADAGATSTHSVAINWGDGNSSAATRLVLGARTFTATHRYLDDNPTNTASDTYTITATITDNDSQNDSGTATQVVNNVKPVLTSLTTSAQSINEGDSITLTGTFTDAGTLDTHTVTVNWGDGVIDAPVPLTVGARTFSLTHRYLDDNPTNSASDLNTVTVTIRDDDTQTGTGTTSLTVNNIKPVLTSLTSNASSDQNIKEGDSITISGTFTDIGTRDTHTVVIAWDDGSTTMATMTESNGSGSFKASHVITSGGIYTATATLRDDDTGSVAGTKTLFVTGVGVHQVGPFKALQVVGTNGNDVVTVDTQGKTSFVVKAGFLAKTGRIIPTAGITLIQVVLRDGNDTAKVYPSILVPAVIDGGAGDDRIDGDNAANVLIGGAGKDTLIGGTARNILIGGIGADTLTGSGNDDILIGGTTSYDSGVDDKKLANDLALLKMLQEWTSTRSLADRVLNLTNGTGAVLAGSGLSLKLGTTVLNDRDKDTLIGAAGADWFFYDVFDLINDGKTDKKQLN